MGEKALRYIVILITTVAVGLVTVIAVNLITWIDHQPVRARPGV
jgi:hypothetical protein